MANGTTHTIDIEGMHCEGCVRRVRKLIEMAGAAEVQHVEIGSASFRLEEDGAGTAEIVAALEEAGFTARPKP